MRDSDKPMSQREAYQRGYAAGYAAAQSGPPREPTREMTLAGQRALDNIWTSWHAPTTQCWRAMYDAWQNEQTGGKAMPATGLSSPDHAGSAGPPDHIEQTGGPIARGEPINQPELRSGPPDHQSAATPSNLSGGSSQEGADGPAADPIADLCARLRALCVCHRRDHDSLCAMCAAADALERLARERDEARQLFNKEYNEANESRRRLRQELSVERDCRKRQTERAERAEAERDTLAAIVRAADAMYAVADHTGGVPGCYRCDAADNYLDARAKWEGKP